jgi:hypothetical protein
LIDDPELVTIGLYDATHISICVNKCQAPRAARQCFKAKRSTAREQIKTVQAIECLPKPIKQGFSDAIWRWSQSINCGKLDVSSPKCTADDPNGVSHPSAKIPLQARQ